MLQWMFLAAVVMGTTMSQVVMEECPNAWIPNDGSCYKFVTSKLTFQEASIFCLQSFAFLVSVNSDSEHKFIQKWISLLDTQSSLKQDWFTSGYRDINGKLMWDADSSEITTDYFPAPTDRDAKLQDPKTKIDLNQIVYRYFGGSLYEYRWAWSRLMKSGPFICEINQQDVWRINQQQRDFSYGTGIKDPNQWEMGPNITSQSQNVVFFESRNTMTTIVLECQATGNPRPDYKWYRKSASQTNIEWITSQQGSRFTITNGKLTITNPDPEKDSSIYTCIASNKLGIVLSNPIEVSYGYIEQFSNVPPSQIFASMYWGKDISCQAPFHNTELSYQWFKKNVFNFIRPELNPQYFLSRNGKLYISEVQAADQDTYFCAIFMAPKTGQVLASPQPPSRNSLGIDLVVQGESANTYGPDIQQQFPRFSPTSPVVGKMVEIECLAYGRLPLYYSWVREDGQLNPESYLKDHNRVLVIPKARLEDTGSYTCVVKGNRNTENRTIQLSLQAPPSFPFPLQNQHADVGSKLTWICSAIGIPRPTYTWYKNGVVLKSDAAEGLTINRNILTINKVDTATHDGMYQCEASNLNGLARSSAQLITLSFKPTFQNSPVDSTKQAAVGGNVTILCRPEAAPRPVIKWFKNGLEIGGVLPNGDLQLSYLTKEDTATYTCFAENSLGSANSSCALIVQAMTVISKAPSDLHINQNETAAFYCTASFDNSKSDIIYSWMFNSHVIDFTGSNSADATHYSMPYAQTQESGMLYVIGAQFRHEGKYTCLVSTVTGSISAHAFLRVNGPPGEPGGVHAQTTATMNLSFEKVNLWWQEGEEHGYPVHKYAIEYQSLYEENWSILKDDIPEDTVHIPAFKDWRGYNVTEGLSPGTTYRFRVRAGNNQIGYGPASRIPSIWYKMAPAPPVHAPDNIGGGGGSVGELHITWDALPRSLWGGETIKYSLHYRLQDDKDLNKKWQTVDNLVSTEFYTYVSRELYYMPYEVKIQAVNEKGKGPNSTIAIVFSAEDMPTNVAPKFTQAYAINGTAGIVEWEPVPDTREDARGSVFAYQINYWLEGDTKCLGKYEDTARFTRIYGNRASGLIIGMEYSLDYCFNLQFLNHAGMGPKTDNYYVGMNFAPPSRYPEFVTVVSHGNESVRIFWRGVSTVWGEEPVIGYKAWWWDAREDIRSAKITIFSKIPTGVIHGVHRDVVYKLRLMGYSVGGDGKKSQDVFFTLGGLVMYDPTTTDIMNSAPLMQVISCLMTILLTLFSLFIAEACM